ncbi:MAG TPA: type I 3-dehydroquinate dehydratase, partial [Chthoniobacterales bacterium]|nr:type I 3-dehydroquinate dehydratase [Chthoniobacterales bacterium]
MTTRGLRQSRPLLVGVIASTADLNAALKTKRLPDLFELRLDSLHPISADLEKEINRLRAPFIITARDPREGGTGKLSGNARRALLQRFLPRAKYIDVELRTARDFAALLDTAKKRKVRWVLSYHNFKSTPSSRSLCAKARRAKALGADVFKVATRTDTPAALSRLIGFITSSGRAGRIPVSAMGIGNLGGISRLLLASCGSVLNYGSVDRPN